VKTSGRYSAYYYLLSFMSYMAAEATCQYFFGWKDILLG
jgi:hypothetical protein